jgi:hypothetical protein
MRNIWPALFLIALAPLRSECGTTLPIGAALPSPSFDSYRVRTAFESKPAPVNLASAKAARHFRTVLRKGAKNGPNFADHFTVVTWGCGTLCQHHAIVDARTGRVHILPIGTGYGVAFRRDSRLLVADPAERCIDPSFTGPDESVWYVWTGERLKQVASLRIVAPCDEMPNLSLNPDASPAALRAVRSAPVSLVR